MYHLYERENRELLSERFYITEHKIHTDDKLLGQFNYKMDIAKFLYKNDYPLALIDSLLGDTYRKKVLKERV